MIFCPLIFIIDVWSGIMSKKERAGAIALFIIYLLVLTWLIIFKMNTHLTYYGFRSLNLKLFAGTARYHGTLYYNEIIYNVLAFIPFGTYVAVFAKKKKTLWGIILPALASFAYEAVQYILMCGIADITDFAANTLGGIVGVITYFIIKGLFKKKHVYIINSFAALIPVMALIYFVFKFVI